MASPGQSTLFTTFSELVTTTYRDHKKTIANSIENHNALFRYINGKGRKRHVDGGLSIVTPIDYGTNGTVKRYSGYDTLDVSAVDVISAAEYPWRQMAGSVTASGYELRVNSGTNAIRNLAKAKLTNLIRSMSNQLASDVYSDGSLANQIGGLQLLVSDLGTGSPGGINATTFPFWKNIVQSAAAPLQGGGAITVGPTTIESLMAPTYYNVTRGTDQPDLIVMDMNYFNFFEQSQVSLKRYAPTDANTKGTAGFVTLNYKNADVIFDGSGIIPANHAYFLNTDYLEFVVHSDCDFDESESRAPVNQDATVMFVLWMGNMASSARRFQAVMKA